MFMHIPHDIHLMHTMITLIPPCILEYTYVHIAACFDRLNSFNFRNKNVWVLNVTNPFEPKKIWVPKSPPLIFDVGVDSHKP